MSGPRLLLVNDDGYGATGLELLRSAVSALTDDVWIVAPAAERSGASHSISLTAPIRARQMAAQEWTVDGTPADCVALALAALMDRPPDVVLSGVNRGPNLADDVVYSGTCGAAREAAVRDIPAIAVSMVSDPGHVDNWSAAEHHLPPLLGQLVPDPVAPFINVNIPSTGADLIAGVQVTRLGSYPRDRFVAHRGNDPRGHEYWWLELSYPLADGMPGTDLAAIRDSYISVTPIRGDHTDDELLNSITHLASTPS